MVAMLERPMRLIRDKSEDFGAERRIFKRTEARGSAPAFRLDHSVAARRQPQVMLDLRDVSVGGMSALSDVPLNQGEFLSVQLPAQANRPAWGAYGRVIRCDQSGMGYRVAVQFDSLPRAA